MPGRLVLLAAALVALACSPAGARRGNTVILASGADLQSPNPLLTTHPLARQVQRYALLVTLVRYDSALQPIPYLAREWWWSAGRTELRFRIHTGLRWHDGSPTTARDAAWTLEAARAPETGYPRRTDLAALLGAAAPDDSTLVLRFSRPLAGIPDVLTDLAILPRHLLDSVPRGRLRQAAWNRRPVGNGPFRFVSWEPNRRWVFAANPAFPPALGGPPRLERFVVAIVDEPTTKLAALASGELDLAGINPAHAAFVREDPRLTVLDYPLLFSYAMVFNTRRAPFDRLAPRRAVAAAIDARAIVDGVLFGFGTPAAGPVPPPLEPGGRALPARAPEGGGAVSGLAFEMLTVGSGEAALEQLLQAQLARRNIRTEIRQLELSTFLDRVEGPTRDFDAAVMGVSGDLGLGHLAPLVTLSGLRPDGDGEKLVRLVGDSAPAAFIYHARGVQGMNRRVRGVRMDLRGELVTL
ncbi:MAG TPA: ABC transporter substrate-binding protein, partial [Gemmatimonadales bacterium]|nr:ABC transporter substrate-binding protein [Gemmatimonadales bacterium]